MIIQFPDHPIPSPKNVTRLCCVWLLLMLFPSLIAGNATQLKQARPDNGRLILHQTGGQGKRGLTLNTHLEQPRHTARTISLGSFSISQEGKEGPSFRGPLAQPVELTYHYDREELGNREPQSIRIYHLNPESDYPEPVDFHLDERGEQIMFQVSKLGSYKMEVEEAGWPTPGIDGFGVAQAKGSASYQYPISLPVGPTGFGPELLLTYNSGIVNGLIGDDLTDTGWVGAGWNLELGQIKYDTITLNGVSEDFHYDAAGVGHTEHQSFLRIERFNRTIANPDSTCLKDPDAYWYKVTNKEGTIFYFGENDQGEGVGSTISYIKTTDNLFSWRPVVYKLWKVVDQHGNTMTIEYLPLEGDTECQMTSYPSSYPRHIYYTTNDSADDDHAEYRVDFDLAGKGYSKVDPVKGVFYGDTSLKLVAVETLYAETPAPGTEANYVPIRQVLLDYDTDSGAETNVLTSIEIQSGDQSTTLPKTSFTYSWEDVWNYYEESSCHFANEPCGDCWTDSYNPSYSRPFLSTVTNGYGGRVEYRYVPVTWQQHNLFRVVSQKTSTDEITGPPTTGTMGTFHYTYSGENIQAVQKGSGGNCFWRALEVNWSKFFGYSQVVVQNPNGSYSRHTYDNNYNALTYQPEFLNGYELTRELFESSPNDPPLESITNFWAVEPYATWPEETRLVYLRAVDTYTAEGITNAPGGGVYHRIIHDYDLAHGQPHLTFEYSDGPTLFRATRKGWEAHPLTGKIVQKYEVLHAGEPVPETLVASTWFSYDNKTMWNDTMETGDAARLTAVRKYTGSGIDCAQTTMVDTLYGYDAYGNIESTTEFEGMGTCEAYASEVPRVTHVDYDEHGIFASTTTNAKNHVNSAVYDYRWQAPTHETDANGSTTVNSYDQFGRILTIDLPGENPNWHSVEYTYPSATSFNRNNPYRSHERKLLNYNEYKDTYTFFNGFGKSIQVQSPGEDNGHVVSHTAFDASGNVWKQSTPQFGTGVMGTYITPDWSQLQAQIINYDGSGRKVLETLPDGSTIQHRYTLDTANPAYNSTGALLIETIDEGGRLKQKVKDVFGNMLRIRDFEGDEQTGHSFYSEVKYRYDIRGNLVETIDHEGYVSTTNYDALNRRINSSDPDLGIWSYTYDTRDNLLTQTDSRGVVTTYQYDDLSRVTNKSYAGGLNAAPSDAVTYHYDEGENGKGRRTGSTDLEGATTTWHYDLRGRKTREKRIMNGAFSHLTSSEGLETKYFYDYADRATLIIYPDGEAVNPTYNLRGQPVALNAYEPLDREDFPTTTPPADWGSKGNVYYANGSQTALGGSNWLTHASWGAEITDGTGVQFSFLAAGATHPKLNHFVAVGNWNTPEYRRIGLAVRNGDIWLYEFVGSASTATRLMEFNADTWYECVIDLGGPYGNMVYIWERDNCLVRASAFPNNPEFSGHTWRYVNQVHTGTGYLDNITLWHTDPNVSKLVTSATYNAQGQPLTRTLGPVGGNLETVRTYSEADHRLASYSVTGLLNITYDYDAKGNITDLSDGNQNITFQYDHLNRLTQASSVGGTYDYEEAYTYNTLGNIITRNGGQYVYRTDKPHAVESAAFAGDYDYDANGNMTRRVSNTADMYSFSYNQANKMSFLGQAFAFDTHFYYDGDGNRLVRDRDGRQTLYIGGFFERSDQGDVKYIRFGEHPIAVRKDGALRFLHNDYLGTASMTTSAGAVVHEVRHLPFGKQIWSSGTDACERDFNGMQQENGGLLDYMARYYDPAIGRFISADTVIPTYTDTQSLNRYSYVTNNPIRYVDPTGHSAEDAVDGWMAMLGFAASSMNGSKAQTAAAVGSAGGEITVSGAYLFTQALGYQGKIEQDMWVHTANLLGDDYSKWQAAKATDYMDSLGRVGNAASKGLVALEAAKGIVNTADALIDYRDGNITAFEARFRVNKSGYDVLTAAGGLSPTTAPASAAVGIAEGVWSINQSFEILPGAYGKSPTALEAAAMLKTIHEEHAFGNSQLVRDVVYQELAAVWNRWTK